jgi:peptidoglycan/LPS O-acetylase OafA/YrhL
MSFCLGFLPPSLHSLLDGKSAVAFFFVLSGFVLHFSWKGAWPEQSSWLGFIVKRCLRIYPLYYMSLLLAFIVLQGLPLSGCPMFHDDASGSLTLLADRHDSRQWSLHALLVVPGVDHQFLNPPIWTLIAEMQISFIFPWLSWLVRRVTSIRGLVVVSLLFVLAPWIAAKTFGTIALIPLFVAGALLAEYHAAIMTVLNPVRGGLLLVLGFTCYLCSSSMSGGPEIFRMYVAAAGAGMMMVSVLALPKLRSLLEWRLLTTCGDLSYGLYVLHFPILMAAAWVTWKWHLPVPLFVIMSFTATLGLAFLLYRGLERPCIVFARRLAEKTAR